MSARTVQFVRKKDTAQVLVGGTRSWTNQLVITSSGCQLLDAILGVGQGLGIPLGTVFLVIEDYPSKAHLMIQAMFTAEAVSHKHNLAVIGQDHEAVFKNLPSIASKSKSASKKKAESKEEAANANAMNIAWRYEKYVAGDENKQGVARSSNMSGANVVASGSSAGSLAGNYDFRAKMNQEEIDDLRNNRLYAAKDLDDLKERISQMESSQVLRILVPSLGNPLYEQGLGTSPENKATRIRRFLSRLRRMVDGKRAIALVTIPKLLFPDDAAVKSFECFADASVQLSSFTLSKEEHGFGDAHGILTVRKLVQLNSLACQYPDTLNYLYTISKKGLDIEKMSLPPEETRTGDGSHSHQAIKGNANLDF